jgi:hypothetical protein
MADLTQEHQHLILADRHLTEGRQRVAELIADINRQTRQGHDTTLAENLLTTFEQTLVQWEEHRVVILDAIARRERSGP